MTDVTVITGGTGGMGLATAKVVGKQNHVIISDLDQSRLDAAAEELALLGVSCESLLCDVTDSKSVEALIAHAAGRGKLVSVIHTAGISPQMADADAILKVNALGTANIINACIEAAHDGFALINVASMAAHMFPSLLLPRGIYPLAFTKPDSFMTKSTRRCRLVPTKFYKRGVAYGMSKDFVIWASKAKAASFGSKGARVVSVSPGSFDTEMGRLETKSGSAEMLRTAALKRFGRSDEIAELLAFCASSRAGYLTGTDILCDGGVVAGRR